MDRTDKKSGVAPAFVLGCADLAQLEHNLNLVLAAIVPVLPCRAEGVWSRSGTNDFITQDRKPYRISLVVPRRRQSNPACGIAVVNSRARYGCLQDTRWGGNQASCPRMLTIVDAH